MTRKLARVVAAAVTATGLLALAAPADAALISYTDRATWLAAAGPLSGTEDFDGFVADASFILPSTVAASNMTLSGTPGFNGPTTQKIDVAPLEFADYSPDGTPIMLVDLTPTNTARVDFTTAVTAWGADFTGLSNDGRVTRMDIFSASHVLLGSITAATTPGLYNRRFIGFDLTGGDAAGYVTFDFDGPQLNEVFAVDHIGFTTVPEPGSLVLVSLGLLGAAARRRPR